MSRSGVPRNEGGYYDHFAPTAARQGSRREAASGSGLKPPPVHPDQLPLPLWDEDLTGEVDSSDAASRGGEPPPG
jgi:hypothetical protein